MLYFLVINFKHHAMDRTLDNGRDGDGGKLVLAVKKIGSFAYRIDYNELRHVPMSILNLILGNAVLFKTFKY